MVVQMFPWVVIVGHLSNADNISETLRDLLLQSSCLLTAFREKPCCLWLAAWGRGLCLDKVVTLPALEWVWAICFILQHVNCLVGLYCQTVAAEVLGNGKVLRPVGLQKQLPIAYWLGTDGNDPCAEVVNFSIQQIFKVGTQIIHF